MTDIDLMLRFCVQLLVILLACKVIGWLGVRFLGQTQVVMEMVAGVMLGPSLFGALAPGAQAWLFPVKATYVIDGATTSARHPSMYILYIVSQLGLILYMFLIGLEFDFKLLRSRAKGALSVSVAGIAGPFLLGALLAHFTFKGGGLFVPGISEGSACLYFGAAMCITAFPMLARIIYERKMAGTSLGTLALGAGASNDVFAWVLLAVVLAFAKGSWTYAAFAIGGGVLFALLTFKVLSRLFARLAFTVERDGEMSQTLFVTTLILLFAGAWTTDAIGIYAVFGAFLMGAAMPRGRFAEELRKRLEAVSVGLLLPFFFIYSGLNTKVSLIDSPMMALITVLACGAAIVGKGVGCALAARWNGESWRDSWAIGTLMNARGLMELIILNIGLQQGVVTPRMYTVMVIMAIVTTLMASPIFRWVYRREPARIDGASVPA